MYLVFIRTGVVEVLSNNDEVTTTLSDGSHFGVICLLTDDRRVASVRAVTICDVFSLSKVNFQSLLEEFLEMRCTLETVALHQLNLLGKEPRPEELRKQGRISTVIPPPHIRKDASHIIDEILMQCNHVAECACHPMPEKKIATVKSPDLTQLEPLSENREMKYKMSPNLICTHYFC